MQFKTWFIEEKDRDGLLTQGINDNHLSFFFKKDNEYFGTDEEGRITFANLKHPSEDNQKNWEKEATVLAFKMSSFLDKMPAQQVFPLTALKKIEVVDSDEILKKVK